MCHCPSVLHVRIVAVYFSHGLLALGRPATRLEARAASASQPSTCSPMRPTCPYTLMDGAARIARRSAPPSAISWACQRPKRIGRKRQRSSAPTSTMGPSQVAIPHGPTHCLWLPPLRLCSFYLQTMRVEGDWGGFNPLQVKISLIPLQSSPIHLGWGWNEQALMDVHRSMHAHLFACHALLALLLLARVLLRPPWRSPAPWGPPASHETLATWRTCCNVRIKYMKHLEHMLATYATFK
jgi:hypothetical protein